MTIYEGYLAGCSSNDRCRCMSDVQTVCTYWLRGLCMRGDACSFLHQYDKDRMPVCRTFVQTGQCNEPDCPFKHAREDIKEVSWIRHSCE